jgi:hypothetical protein
MRFFKEEKQKTNRRGERRNQNKQEMEVPIFSKLRLSNAEA